MTISIKGGSGLTWVQDGAVIGVNSGFISSGSFVTVLDITQECLVSSTSISIDTECDAEIRITRDGQVFLQDTFLRDSLSNQEFSLITGLVPLYCRSSFKVEIRRVAGAGFTSAFVQYTTGTFEPI